MWTCSIFGCDGQDRKSPQPSIASRLHTDDDVWWRRARRPRIERDREKKRMILVNDGCDTCMRSSSFVSLLLCGRQTPNSLSNPTASPPPFPNHFFMFFYFGYSNPHPNVNSKYKGSGRFAIRKLLSYFGRQEDGVLFMVATILRSDNAADHHSSCGFHPRPTYLINYQPDHYSIPMEAF